MPSSGSGVAPRGRSWSAAGSSGSGPCFHRTPPSLGSGAATGSPSQVDPQGPPRAGGGRWGNRGIVRGISWAVTLFPRRCRSFSLKARSDPSLIPDHLGQSTSAAQDQVYSIFSDGPPGTDHSRSPLLVPFLDHPSSDDVAMLDQRVIVDYDLTLSNTGSTPIVIAGASAVDSLPFARGGNSGQTGTAPCWGTEPTQGYLYQVSTGLPFTIAPGATASFTGTHTETEVRDWVLGQCVQDGLHDSGTPPFHGPNGSANQWFFQGTDGGQPCGFGSFPPRFWRPVLSSSSPIR